MFPKNYLAAASACQEAVCVSTSPLTRFPGVHKGIKTSTRLLEMEQCPYMRAWH